MRVHQKPFFYLLKMVIYFILDPLVCQVKEKLQLAGGVQFVVD